MIVLWIVAAVVVAAIVAGIAGARGYSGFGFFVYALIFWPLALVHVMCLPRTADNLAQERQAVAKREGRIPCPFCAEPIMATAKLCPHCRSDLTQVAPQAEIAGAVAAAAPPSFRWRAFAGLGWLCGAIVVVIAIALALKYARG